MALTPYLALVQVVGPARATVAVLVTALVGWAMTRRRFRS